MSLGTKIKKLRTEKNLTQKDLSDQLHVTFQTVSKWEKDENEPDISTLRELAKLFNCSLDFLLSENLEEDNKPSEPVIIEKEVPVIKETIIVHKNETHVCAKCGKDIPEDELAAEDNFRKARFGRHTKTVSNGQTYYHKSCLEEIRKERVEIAEKKKSEKAKKSKKRCYGWGISCGVVALVISLLVFLLVPSINSVVHPALGVLFSLIIGYGIFSMLYCIISGSYICDVFMWCANLTVKFPGLIFSWSLDGLAWLIGMKILFAILGFLIGVAALLFAIAFSALLGGFSFPFILVHNIRTNYEDAL